MANPLKVLVDLQARKNVAVSGTLEVTGSTTLVGNASVSSLTASSVISGTTGYFTGLYVNGNAVNGGGGGSGTVNSGSANKLAIYSGSGTTLDDAAGLTYSNDKLTISGSSSSALALEVTGAVSTTDNLTVGGALVLGFDRIRRSGGGDFLLSTGNDFKINSTGGNIELTGSTFTSGSLTVGGGGVFTANTGTFNGQLTAAAALIVSDGVLNVNNGNISGSADINAGGNITAAGTVTARSGLTVTGSIAATQNISGSGTLQAGGAATLAGGLTVTGAALNASAVAVSASALNVANDISARSGSFSGDVTITGNLTVLGTPTQIVSNTVNIGDKNINLGTGSATLSVLDGGGIDLGTGAEVQWRYNDTSAGWKSNVHLDLASTKVYKINNTEVLSATKLGNAVISSSLQTLGTLTGLTVNGATQLTGNLNVSGGYIYAPATGSTTNYAAAVTSGITHIPQALGLLSDAIDTKTTAAAVKSSVEAAYNKVRLVTTGSFSGGTATVNLVTVATALGADVANFKGLQKHYLSVDVLVRNGAADADWENDLVAVHLSGSGAGSTDSVNVIIDALTEATEYRLIVVNEKSGSFSV